MPAIGSVPSNQTSGNMPYSKTYVFILSRGEAPEAPEAPWTWLHGNVPDVL